MKYRNKCINLTIYIKLLILAFIVLLLTFGSSIQVYASEITEPLPSGGASSETYTIIGIDNIEAFANLPTLEIVRTSTQDTIPLLYYIRNNKLLSVTAIIADSSGNVLPEKDWPTITVSWPCRANNTLVNTTVCGEYVETGTIPLPDDSYAWGEGVSSVITFPVRVYEPEAIEIVRIDSYESDYNRSFSLELSADIVEFLRKIPLQKACRCYDASGNEYSAPVIYNGEAVRTDAVGIYHITVTFEAPLNCRFSETLDIPTYSIPVTVQAPGQPRLDVSYIGGNNEYIVFPWIAPDIDLDTMEIWLSENNGEWRMLEHGWEAFVTDSTLSLNLNPYAAVVTSNNSYRIQAKYEGGQTGIASFTYTNEGLSDQGYLEGDRDGGDTDGNPPTDSENNENTNNTPPTDSTNNGNSSTGTDDNSTDTDSKPATSIPASVETLPETDTTTLPKESSDNREDLPDDTENELAIETSTPTDTASDREEPYLLGSEINRMIRNLGTARFSAETIMLDIPEDAIASLGIRDTDRLLVTVLPLENNGFTIDISKNDVAITNVSSMQISLPYQPPENTTPVLINEDKEKVADGDYEPQTGLASFTINETGTFYIQDEEVPLQDSFAANTLTATEISTSDKETDTSVYTLIAIAATVMICFAAATIFIHTKRRRR